MNVIDQVLYSGDRDVAVKTITVLTVGQPVTPAFAPPVTSVTIPILERDAHAGLLSCVGKAVIFLLIRVIPFSTAASHCLMSILVEKMQDQFCLLVSLATVKVERCEFLQAQHSVKLVLGAAGSFPKDVS
jgi:hypothetical protein